MSARHTGRTDDRADRAGTADSAPKATTGTAVRAALGPTNGAVFATSTLAVAAWRGPNGWTVHVEQVGVRFS